MRTLIFAPHRDDEIIGVGGTILKRKSAGGFVAVAIVTARKGEVLPESTQRIHEEMIRCHAYCGIDKLIEFPFAANKLELFSRLDFNRAFWNAVSEVAPDEVYIPFWGDMQKDHQ